MSDHDKAQALAALFAAITQDSTGRWIVLGEDPETTVIKAYEAFTALSTKPADSADDPFATYRLQLEAARQRVRAWDDSTKAAAPPSLVEGVREALEKLVVATHELGVASYRWVPDAEAAQWETLTSAVGDAEADISAALASAPPPAEPMTYAYLYRENADCTVWRFNTGGREINGSKPIRSMPLYAAPPPPSPDGVVRALVVTADMRQAALEKWGELVSKRIPIFVAMQDVLEAALSQAEAVTEGEK